MQSGYIVSEIQWDTDGETVDLPESDFIPYDEIENVEEEAADWLSGKYGFCVLGFNYRMA